MERWMSSKAAMTLTYLLLIVLILFFTQQIYPIISWIYGFAKAVLTPFIIAMIISYVLNPVVCVLNDRGVPRTIAVLLIYALFIGSLTVMLMNLIPMFISQLKELNAHLPEMSMQAQEWLHAVHENQTVPDTIKQGIQDSLLRIEKSISSQISNLLNRIGSTISTLFVAFIIPFVAFYILKDFKLLERAALTIVPKRRRKGVVRLLMEIDHALGSYVRGQFLVCVIVGLLAYVGYLIIGMPYPLLLAFVVAIFNIVPYLGPYLGAAPAVIMAATVSVRMMVLVVIANTIVQVLEGNVISPQVVGKTLHMHPLTIIFVLLVGGELAGIVGLILGVPMFAAAKVIVQHVFTYYIRRKPVT
ncbi:AI-2E family transporter [Marinicrinis sediminis]|uniref:AI-2E family transporter n=1 Tax=Marinicrinis sediminis TaxID=1652465 RepID=A0ABW5R5X9_9BACL